jgi:nucleoside-diphosphate kinase
MTERTLCIIKPDAVEQNAAGNIIAMIQKAGFKILAMKMMRLTPAQAGSFYEIHKERPFYQDLINYMISGPIVPVALEKENAVEDYRKLIGSTNPEDADEGTVRKLYGTSIERNAVHGSDSPENGVIEVNFFFSKAELVGNE